MLTRSAQALTSAMLLATSGYVTASERLPDDLEREASAMDRIDDRYKGGFVLVKAEPFSRCA